MAKLRQLVKMQKGILLFSNNAVAKQLVSLPRTATLIGIMTQVVTPFDDTGTNLIQIGTKGDPNYFVADFSASAAGFHVNTLLLGGSLEELGFGGPVVDVWATYTGSNTNSTAGKAIVIVVYADPFVNPGAA